MPLSRLFLRSIALSIRRRISSFVRSDNFNRCIYFSVKRLRKESFYNIFRSDLQRRDGECLLWLLDIEVFANLPREFINYLGMSRHCRSFAGSNVKIYGMPRTFAQKFATVFLKMPQKSVPLHQASTKSSSFTTFFPAITCSASSLLASSTIATASLRFSRASSRVEP